MRSLSLRRVVPARAAAVLLVGGVGLAFAAALHTTVAAQQGVVTRVFHVRETGGIRRTEYPVSVSLQLPKGTLSDVTHARVMTNSQEVPVQFTGRSAWDDGSVQTLEIDFNATLDPEEDRRYELQAGASITAAARPTRGLSAEDRATAIVVGNLTFNKSGSPLLASATYRGEGIEATGQSGVTLTDTNGRRFDLSKAQTPTLEVVKGGPLLVALRYFATVPIDDTTSIPVEIVMEMPNSKTWLKSTVTVTDRSRRLKDIAVERPYAWSGFPVLWDFGTDSGTYGVFRAAADAVTLTQTVNAGGPGGWRIESGAGSQRRVIEMSTGSRNRVASGWGHLQDAKVAVAFGFARFGRDAGTYSIALSGGGQATFRYAPTTAQTQQQMVLYEHFVATPIAIGAATNPTAMLSPLAVSVER